MDSKIVKYSLCTQLPESCGFHLGKTGLLCPTGSKAGGNLNEEPERGSGTRSNFHAEKDQVIDYVRGNGSFNSFCESNHNAPQKTAVQYSDHDHNDLTVNRVSCSITAWRETASILYKSAAFC